MVAPGRRWSQVAERLLAEDRRTGVALVPSGEWGSRVLAAFQAAFTAGGGHLEGCLGPCPLCLCVSKHVDITYKNKKWDVDF